jgi:hypothetical protein
MSSLAKFAPAMNCRVVAALACVTLATSPGLSAGRHHTPHANQPAAQGTGSPGGGTSVPAGEIKPAPGETSVDAAVSKTTPKEPTERGGKAADGKSPIDLTRPDNGYSHDNLRRRAARASLVATQKKPPAVPTAAVAPHPPGPTTTEHPRNSAGATVPAASTAFGAARPEPVRAEPAAAVGGAKNNLGLGAPGAHPQVHVATTPAPPKPPVQGINGTSLHQAGPGIGGPAKDHSPIAGSSYRHK